MRFMFLTPGTGHFYCGSCLRDNTLAAALRRLGHDVSVAPLYLPLMLEEPTPEDATEPVHMGGINMYLQQKTALAGKLPRFVANLLDRRPMAAAPYIAVAVPTIAALIQVL